jgi:hypothetical protein
MMLYVMLRGWDGEQTTSLLNLPYSLQAIKVVDGRKFSMTLTYMDMTI